jgi:hypothetical protein
MDVDSIICLLCVQMWDLAGTRLSWSEHQAHQGPVRPPRGEPRAGERRRWDEDVVGPVDDERAGRRHVVLMTLVQGLLMLLRWGPGESSRIFTTAWRWYYRECLRACGHIFRMRESWSSVWAFRWSGRTLIHRASCSGCGYDWATSPRT